MKNAGYILSNQMEVFNNTEVLKEASVPSLPWGQMITKANMQKNQLLLKTHFMLTKVVQEDLSDEGNLFGALWQYHQVKMSMKSMLNWGTEGHNQPEGLIKSDVSFTI